MADNNPASWGAIPSQQAQQQNSENPGSWGAIPASAAVPSEQLWGNVPTNAVPASNQKTPLDPEIDRILAREAQGSDPKQARTARVEQHIRRLEANGANPYTDAFMQGASYGFSDEAAAGLQAVTGQGDYSELLDADRERLNRARKDSPIGMTMAEIGGNLATLPFTAPLKLVQGATYLPRVVNAAATGGVLSGIYGYGTGEGTQDRLNKGLEGVALGVPLGAAGETLVSGASHLLKKAFGANRTPSANTNPQQKLQENAEFNIPLTTGEATGNLKQQSWENAARNNAKGAYPAEQFQAFDQNRADAIRRATGQVGDNFGPQVNPENAGAVTAQAMKDRSNLLRADADNAYAAAANKNAWIAADEVTNLGSRVTQELEKAGIRLDTYGNYPGSQNAMNILKRVSGFEGAPQNGQVLAQSLEGLEQARKSLLKVRPGSGEDARALGEIRKQFDHWISDAIDKRLFQGDPTALDDLKKARALWSQYKGMTASDRGPMQVISRMVNEERTGAEVANWLLSSSTVNQAGTSARVASQVKNFVGATSDEWQGIRAAAWDKLINDTTGNPRNAQQIAKAITDFSRGHGKALAGVLFTPQELSEMQRLAVAIRNTATDPRANNPSRSGYEIVRSVADKLGLMLGVGGVAGAYSFSDPRFLAVASLPALRYTSSITKLNAALRPQPRGIGAGVEDTFRLPQRAVPALLGHEQNGR